MHCIHNSVIQALKSPSERTQTGFLQLAYIIDQSTVYRLKKGRVSQMGYTILQRTE